MKYLLLAILAAVLPLHAHDTWVQVHGAESPVGQPVYADLMLGNHGNNHRDFLLDSKIPLAGSTLTLLPPEGAAVDLKPALVDTGLTEKDGFWSVKVQPQAAGLYCIAHTYDAVVSYAPKRSLKSAKAYFRAGDGGGTGGKFSEPLGHPLEIIPLDDPARLQAGGRLAVRVLFKGQQLKDTVVSCIPRGTELADDFDPRHEARTDDDGVAALALPEANYYLVVVHRKAPEETGEKYPAGSEYGATLALWVGGR